MKRFIETDFENKIIGFIYCSLFDLEFYKELYPNKKYIETELEDLHLKQGYEYKFINGEIIETEKTDTNYLLNKLNQEYIQSVASITSGVTSEEISTWTKQESEARNWLIDNNANTPLIDAICLSRGCDKSYLVNKIIEKANAYASAIGALTGERQAKEKEILG